MKKAINLIFFIGFFFCYSQQHLYTDEAKAVLKDRITNGYITGTGFDDDVASINSSVSSFELDPGAYTPSFTVDGGIYDLGDRQQLHHSALYAYVQDDVTLANLIADEILATVTENDMNTVEWDSVVNNQIRLIHIPSYHEQAAEIKKTLQSYEFIEELATSLDSTETAQIEAWFQRWGDIYKSGIEYELNTYWGDDWENIGLTQFLGENLYPESTYSTAYPVEDSSGNYDPDLVMTGAQNQFNNRFVEMVNALHGLSIHNGDTYAEFECREYVKNLVKYGLFPDGSFWELIRNKNEYSINALGVWYSFSTLCAVVTIAHKDAMAGSYPDDLLYDYETSDGIVEGSTNITTNGYLGSSTTDGSTLKSIKTFILGQSKYYRSTANGGWNDVRYFDGLPLDMTGNSERDYSTPQAIANLYYKDDDLSDFYLYNTGAGYPVKDTYDDGFFDGGDGNMGTAIIGMAWYEMEDYFFQGEKEVIFYNDEAKAVLKDRFENGYVTGTGFDDDISQIISNAATFVNDPDLYRPTFGENPYVPSSGHSLHTSALYAYAIDSVALANVVATELLGIVENNDLYTTWWEDSKTERWDILDSSMIQCSKWKKMMDSYYLVYNLQTVLSISDKETIEAFFERAAYLAYTGFMYRTDNTFFGSGWDSESTLMGYYTGAQQAEYPLYDSNGDPLTDYLPAIAQDIYNNRFYDIVLYFYAWGLEHGNLTYETTAREYFKLTLKYGIFPDGTTWEIYRNEENGPFKGVSYGNITLGTMVEMAFLDALAGSYPDDLLFDYSTSDGVVNGSTTITQVAYEGSSTTDGVTEKSLLTYLKAQSNYLRSSANGGWNDVRYYYNDTDDILTQLDAEGVTQPSSIPAMANLYYKDPDLEYWYKYDTSVGYPVKQMMREGYMAPLWTEDVGPWGNYIASPMWIEMEDYFFNGTTITTPVTNSIFGDLQIDNIYLNGGELDSIYFNGSQIYGN